MPEPLAVRRGGNGDAPALAQLGRESFIATFAHLYRAEDLAAFLAGTHTPERVSTDLANPDVIYFVAERDGVLLGYAKLMLACAWPEHARGGRVVELKQLYTAPGATGGGIGAALMEQVLAAARERGADEIQLSVWQGNHGAQRFYRRFGFEPRAEIHFKVGEQVDDEFLYAAMI
jgi:ribosomal protein S18 acetylase RimI-like enzyme